ncbi:MAG: HNH endonuclease [Sarcina sp.]
MERDKLVTWIKELIQEGKLWKFYKSKEWRKEKAEVLKEQKDECQECKRQGKITKADTVHHVQFVRKHPGLALSKYYIYQGKQYRNLIAVCAACHNKLHPEKLFKKKEQLNEEKW